jgi:hypothetical protein
MTLYSRDKLQHPKIPDRWTLPGPYVPGSPFPEPEIATEVEDLLTRIFLDPQTLLLHPETSTPHPSPRKKKGKKKTPLLPSLDSEEVRGTLELEARIKGPLLLEANVLRLLDHYQDWVVEEYVERRSRVIGAVSAVYRVINTGPMILKTKLETLKYRDAWFTVVLSSEREVPPDEMTLVGKYFSTTTEKKRWSRWLLPSFLRLDITQIGPHAYGVEVEVILPTEPTPLPPDLPLQFLSGVKEVVSLLQDSPLPLTRKRYELVREVVSGTYPWSSPLLHVARARYQTPRTLDYSHFLSLYHTQDLFLTPKKDGTRRFLLLLNGRVYSIDTHNHVRLLDDEGSYQGGDPVLLDTEYTPLTGTYHLFDLLQPGTLLVRLRSLKAFFLSHTSPRVQWVLKPYFPVPVSDRMEFIAQTWKGLSEDPTLDGLILTRGSSSYLSPVWKWKPQVTVDLLATSDGHLYAGGNKEVTSLFSLLLPSSFPCPWSGVVVEWKVEDPKTLTPLRPRPDKRSPNSYEVVLHNLTSLPLTHLWTGLGCFLMRKYHNQVKRQLLRQGIRYLRRKLGGSRKPLRSLDIGSGQGGDLNKWSELTQVFCVEPKKESRREFRERVAASSEPLPELVLIRHRVCQENLKKILSYLPTQGIHLTTLFFCLNQFQVGEEETLTHLLSQVMAPTSVLLTIFMDEEALSTRSGVYQGNTCYSLTPLDEKRYEITLYGTRVIREVERGISLTTLDHLLTPLGFHLKYTRLLDHPYPPLSPEEKGLSSLYRLAMFCRG